MINVWVFIIIENLTGCIYHFNSLSRVINAPYATDCGWFFPVLPPSLHETRDSAETLATEAADLGELGTGGLQKAKRLSLRLM